MMTDPARGLIAIVTACVIWGLSPLFYKLIAHIPPIEVLAHRTLWSLAFFAAVLTVQGRLRVLLAAFASWRTLAVVAVASVMIAINWIVFITSIQVGVVVEASLGYFIYPLVSVVLGAVVFRERLGRAQRAAVALAAVAVAVLAWGLGAAPWVALLIAVTFGLYGVIKKRLALGPVVSVTAEVAVLAPAAVAVLIWSHPDGRGIFGTDLRDGVILAFSGLMTGLPLVLFSAAARRVSMSTIGLVQYLNPSLQFAVATLIFLEPLTQWHAIAFPMIWAALGLYSFASWRTGRVSRRAAKSVSTSGTTR